LQRNDLPRAEEHLRKAGWNDGEESSTNTPYAPVANLAVRLRLKQGNRASALQLSQQAVRQWPQELDSALTRAEVLQAVEQHDEAVKFLAQSILHWPDQARLYQLQAMSFERLQQGVAARQSMATYYEKMGALPASVEQLRQARAMSTDFYVQTQLDVRIRQLQETLMENRALLERFR